eukprot:TRINITY_DN3839_c0_g1_i1.p1 TRINITY_DN3839_c0_g1~~TRINITY_DN3839_c0_g1_i1.p1  ORF type:complete len:174 (-),score=50.39 TRINITY_DN3839_c0_g1_i1:164-685(-)
MARKQNDLPILNSSIQYVKPEVPAFLRRLQEKNGPSIHSKFEKEIIDEKKEKERPFRADEEPSYDAPEVLVNSYRNQEGLPTVEAKSLNEEKKEEEIVEQREEKKGSESTIVEKEVKENGEDKSRVKKTKKRASGVQFSSSKSTSHEDTPKRMKPSPVEKQSQPKLSFDFEDE